LIKSKGYRSGAKPGRFLFMKLSRPLAFCEITQLFGKEFYTPDHPAGFYHDLGLAGHNGLDLRATSGRDVFAAHDGTISHANHKDTGYGIEVRILGQDAELGFYSTIYCHFKECLVEIGQEIKRGERIGISDNTGLSTGPHLHFGLRFLENDKMTPKNLSNGYYGWIDPTPFMDKDWLKLPIDLRYGNGRSWATYMQEVKAMGILAGMLKRLPTSQEVSAFVYGGWRNELQNSAMWEIIRFLSKSEYMLGKRPYIF
jgi:murein DD-endopeptidase MepM/ murein hydrolase activator NlpD